jgi:HD-like signal output (HDOD) protein
VVKYHIEVEEKLDQMATLNFTVPKVMAVSNDLNSSARDLVKVIQMDPVLTAKVLKLVNSAYFALREEVTSLSKAIIMLGINTIKNLAMSTAVTGSLKFDDKVSVISSENFWRYSVGVAALSSQFAREMRGGRQEVDNNFIVGLLHVIGKAFLIQFYPKEYNDVVHEVERLKCPATLVERQLLGVTHEEIGTKLAEKWQLPDPVKDGILHYANPTKSDYRSTRFVAVASSLMKEDQIGYAGDYFVHPIPDIVWEELGSDEEHAREVMDTHLDRELEKASAFIRGGV